MPSKAGILEIEIPYILIKRSYHMTTQRNQHANSEQAEQLSLQIPGFDFTIPHQETAASTQRAVASDLPSAAGQLRLKLNV